MEDIGRVKIVGLDTNSYKNIHKWLNRHYKKTACEQCGQTDRLLDWANITGVHAKDITHYKCLCRKCHKRFDGSDMCKNGHTYTKETLYITPAGHWQCRPCKRQYIKRFREDNPGYFKKYYKYERKTA